MMSCHLELQGEDGQKGERGEAGEKGRDGTPVSINGGSLTK